jgi:hypothetical protein
MEGTENIHARAAPLLSSITTASAGLGQFGSGRRGCQCQHMRRVPLRLRPLWRSVRCSSCCAEPEGGQGPCGVPGVVAAGRADAGVPGHFQDPDAEVTQGSHDLRSVAGADLGGVFAVADVADVVQHRAETLTTDAEGRVRSRWRICGIDLAFDFGFRKSGHVYNVTRARETILAAQSAFVRAGRPMRQLLPPRI